MNPEFGSGEVNLIPKVDCKTAEEIAAETSNPPQKSDLLGLMLMEEHLEESGVQHDPNCPTNEPFYGLTNGIPSLVETSSGE